MSDGERRGRFDALFASYRSDIVAYCSWRAASASDAQDAVAEVFLTAWRRRTTRRPILQLPSKRL
jgi:DNA-directed RNA polymerase specialized sigma24 family protein